VAWDRDRLATDESAERTGRHSRYTRDAWDYPTARHDMSNARSQAALGEKISRGAGWDLHNKPIQR
jgi:hypothetical protein